MEEQNKPIDKKKEEKKLQYLLPPPNNAESCKIGELFISSEMIRADQLLLLLLGALENDNLKEYLDVVNKKKQAGNYYG